MQILLFTTKAEVHLARLNEQRLVLPPNLNWKLSIKPRDFYALLRLQEDIHNNVGFSAEDGYLNVHSGSSHLNL